MKLNILSRALMAAGCVLAFAACDEDSWNKENLDGYDSDQKPTVVETREYTLTDADYAAIAKNSTNMSLAEQGGYSSELAALSSTHTFTGKLDPKVLLPPYMGSQSFPYYILDNKSYVKVTFNVAAAADPVVTAALAAYDLSVSEEEYSADVWESDKDFINAFAPSKDPSKYLPAMLKNKLPDAQPGTYALVSYNMATQEPVFGNVGGEDPDVPVQFEMTDVLGSVEDKTDYVVNGVVTGICGCGFTVTDKGGTILVYMGNGYDGTTYPIGTQIKVTATTGAYKGLMQFKNAEIEVMGTQEYTYPDPVYYDRAALDVVMNDINNKPFRFVRISGTVSVSGNNININLDGEGTAVGSIYYATDAQKALLTDGSTVIVRGWLAYLSGSKYCNIIATAIENAENVTASYAAAPAAEVPTRQENVMYVYNDSRWSEAKDVVVLNPADYTAMGQTYGNLSGNGPQTYLPVYLKNKFPYAAADAEKYVVYKYYSSSDKSTTRRVTKFVYNGSEWEEASSTDTETLQFARVDGEWKFDPSPTITLIASKNDATSTAYFTACVNYVRDQVPDGDKYVTSYGNNEYWSGSSWYQNNIDLRAGKAREQYSEGWGDMTNDEIVETMKSRFVEQTLLHAVTELNPDATPDPDIQVYYTIEFYAYTGVATTGPHAAKYKVTGKGEFAFDSVKWNF